VTPDSGKTALRSRLGRNYRQLPTSKRYARAAGCAEIVYLQDITLRNRIWPPRLFSWGWSGTRPPGSAPYTACRCNHDKDGKTCFGSFDLRAIQRLDPATRLCPDDRDNHPFHCCTSRPSYTGVTNRPYSAMVKATAVQKLADGTTITKVTTTKEAGDSEGRTMRQINLERLNPLGLVRDRRSDRPRCVADGRESERKELEA
jgi:hypothetical protein